MAGLTEEEKEILYRAHEIKERLRAEELEAGEITLEEAKRQEKEAMEHTFGSNSADEEEDAYRITEEERVWDSDDSEPHSGQIGRRQMRRQQRKQNASKLFEAAGDREGQDEQEPEEENSEWQRPSDQHFSPRQSEQEQAEQEEMGEREERRKRRIKVQNQFGSAQKKQQTEKPRERTKKEKRKKKKHGGVGKILLVILLAIFLIIAGGVAIVYGVLRTRITVTNYQPYETTYVRAADVASSSAVKNILLIGTDNRVSNDASRSDAMILVSINRDKHKLVMTSILRDSYVNIPGYGQNRINHAYQMGGPALLIQTIEENFKVGIDSYVQVDFYDFIDVIDSIGGVEIEVTQDELQYVNGYISELNHVEGKEEGYSFLESAGLHTLNGRQALGYSRIRIIGTDFARTGRQRAVLNAIVNKVKSNPLKLISACNSILADLTTNINDNEMTALLMTAPLYLFYDMNQFQVPVNGCWWNALTPEGQEVLGIDFESNNAQLRSAIYD